jgi:hypothetical protein
MSIRGLRQSFQQRTDRHRTLRAGLDHVSEHTLHALQMLDLHPNLRQVLCCDVMHSSAGAGFLIGKVEQAANFIKGEPQIPRTTDEAQTINVA